MRELKARNIFKSVNYKVEEGSEKNLKRIKIVEERPTGEISTGAGIGADGGRFAISIKENNYLGEGKQLGFDIELEKDYFSWNLVITILIMIFG